MRRVVTSEAERRAATPRPAMETRAPLLIVVDDGFTAARALGIFIIDRVTIFYFNFSPEGKVL